MNKIVLATLITTSLVMAPLVSAYRGDPNVQGPNYSPERHTAMQEIFKAGKNGYANWLKLMENKAWGLKEVITNSDIFAEFATAHIKGVDAVAEFRNKYNLGTSSQGKGLGLRDGSGYGRNR